MNAEPSVLPSLLGLFDQTETGMPKLVMRFKTLQPIFASVCDWAEFEPEDAV
jgi:hypothetical protein